MKKLEYEIKETLIPAIVGKNYISDDTRRIFSLQARLGGLGLRVPGSLLSVRPRVQVILSCYCSTNKGYI